VDKNEAALFYLLRDIKARYPEETDKAYLHSYKRWNLLAGAQIGLYSISLGLGVLAGLKST
jgi:hypothetical protein